MDYQAQNRKGFDVMSCFVIKEDNWHKKINYLDSEDADEDKEKDKKLIEADNKNKDINNDKVSDDKNNIIDNNNLNKDNVDNKVDDNEGKLIELIDKENESMVNNKSNISNNNRNRNNRWYR
jgi:hypothetical protein